MPNWRKRMPIPRGVEQRLDSALDTALSIQQAVVTAYVQRIRVRKPTANPAEIIASLDRRYIGTVAAIGGASGGAAGIPGVGTVATVASAVAEVTAFVSATALYTLALAEIHGVPTHDREVRRALVLSVLVGDAAIGAIDIGAAAQGKHWAQVIGRSRREAISGINARLARTLVTHFGARQGALAVGRALPLGIGAGLGAVGNAAVARGCVSSARKVFGPAPAMLPPRVIEVN